MTTFLLIRHALSDLVGWAIAGRQPGVHLNAEGRVQAGKLAERLALLPIQHIFSSPLERAVETAAPLAKRLGLPLQIAPAVNEIDFGGWTGRTFADLNSLDAFRRWNQFRRGVRIPHGEMMIEVQARLVSQMVQWRDAFPDATIAVVSHGDPIRSAVAYWLGMPLDLLAALEILPASATTLQLDDQGARMIRLDG